MAPRSRSLLAGVIALSSVALGGGGLAVASTVPPIDDPAAPGALGDAGETSGSASYRFEMFMEMSMLGMNVDGSTPLITGEVADGQSRTVTDLGVMFAGMIDDDDMPPELRGADLTMEMVTDGTDLYLRAPFLAAVADESDDDSLAALSELGDGWGYVDGSTMPGAGAADLAGALGIGGADPNVFFELLADVEGAEQIGTEDIRGVDTTGVRANVNLGELLAAQGTAAAVPDAESQFGDATFPIEVWIDKDGLIRRITFEITGEAMAEAAEAAGEEIPSEMLGDLDLSMTIEMFDYDASDIVIDIPTEFVDITDEFLQLLEQAG